MLGHPGAYRLCVRPCTGRQSIRGIATWHSIREITNRRSTPCHSERKVGIDLPMYLWYFIPNKYALAFCRYDFHQNKQALSFQQICAVTFVTQYGHKTETHLGPLGNISHISHTGLHSTIGEDISSQGISGLFTFFTFLYLP